MTVDDRIILLDTNSLYKNEIDKILEEELSFSKSELITNKNDLEQQHFNSIKVIIINEEISWLNVPAFLKQLSVDYPFITKVVFSVGTPTKIPTTTEQRYFDGSVGNFQDNSHLFGSVLSFAIQRTKEKIQFSELYKEYKLLFDSTPIGFFRSTEEGNLLLFNPAMIKLFGYENEEEMSNVQIKDLYYNPERRELVLENFENRGYYSSQQEKMKKKNGEAFWASMQARAIYDDKNELEYYEGSLTDITRQKELELHLQNSEKQYRTLFESTGTGICVVNENSIIELCNSRFEELTGYLRSDIEKKMKWTDFIPETEISKLSQLSSSIRKISDPIARRFETKFVNKKGQERECLVFLDYIPEKKQSMSSIIDITEIKQIESELKAAKQRYTKAKDIAQAGEFEYSIETEEIHKSEEIVNLFGFRNEEDFDGSFFAFVHIEDQEKLRETFQISIKENLPIATSFRVLTLDGLEKHLYLRADAILENKKPVKIIGLLQDISPIRKTEQELRESESRFKNIFGSSPFGMFMFELNEENQMIISDSNKASDKILGVDTSMYIGKTLEEAFPALVGTELPERYELAAKEGISWSSNQVNYKDGRISGAFEVHAFQTSPNVVSVAFQDITDRIEIQEELKESEEKYRTLIETSPNSITQTDLNGNFIFGNEQSFKFLGVENLEELQKSKITDFISPDDLEESSNYMQQIFEEEIPITTEFTAISKDGSIKPSESTVSLLRDQDGNAQGFLGIVRDITERKLAEKELKSAFDQIEKNLEQFAVLVDSIRNPLAVIVGLVDQYGKEEKEIVIKHANLIDDIISHIDERTLESEEVRRFLKKHFD